MTVGGEGQRRMSRRASWRSSVIAKSSVGATSSAAGEGWAEQPGGRRGLDRGAAR